MNNFIKVGGFIVKIQERRIRVLLLGLLAITMLFVPMFTAQAQAASYTTVEEAEEYITQQEEIADAANEEISGAEIFIKQETVPMYSTFWALVPPLVAIALALITKEK